MHVYMDILRTLGSLLRGGSMDFRTNFYTNDAEILNLPGTVVKFEEIHGAAHDLT